MAGRLELRPTFLASRICDFLREEGEKERFIVLPPALIHKILVSRVTRIMAIEFIPKVKSWSSFPAAKHLTFFPPISSNL